MLEELKKKASSRCRRVRLDGVREGASLRGDDLRD